MGVEYPVLVPEEPTLKQPQPQPIPQGAPVPVEYPQPTFVPQQPPHIFYEQNFVTPLEIAQIRLNNSVISLRIALLISLLYILLGFFFVPCYYFLLALLFINVIGTFAAISRNKVLLVIHFISSFIATCVWASLFFITFFFWIPLFVQVIIYFFFFSWGVMISTQVGTS